MDKQHWILEMKNLQTATGLFSNNRIPLLSCLIQTKSFWMEHFLFLFHCLSKICWTFWSIKVDFSTWFIFFSSNQNLDCYCQKKCKGWLNCSCLHDVIYKKIMLFKFIKKSKLVEQSEKRTFLQMIQSILHSCWYYYSFDSYQIGLVLSRF